MLRLFLELDCFRKLPPEHRAAVESPEGAATLVARLLSLVLIATLAVGETWTFMTPVRKQRFDLDMESSVDAGSPRKMRVLLNVTVHDFPCIDLSLDYQDVMGTRAVDVHTTIYKQRLHKNGSVVGETMRNNPKAAVQSAAGAAATNPSLSKNLTTGNTTCGHCYGALPDGECCNTCSDVIYAYRLKRWALPRIEDIEQCRHDGTEKSAYQPPQIIHLEDYSSDDYMPKFVKFGSLAPSGTEARIATPFRTPLRLNFSLPPLNSSLYGGGDRFQPLSLNFTLGSLASSIRDLDDADEEAQPWPDCVRRNVIVHGLDIQEALTLDLTPYGVQAGCAKNDCSSTDKFKCESVDRCAGVCQKLPECRWWTWGNEEGEAKCWLRTERHRRSNNYGFSSGSKRCAPPENATDPGNASESSPDQNSGTNKSSASDSADAGLGEPAAPPRRLAGLDDDLEGWGNRRLYSPLNLGMPLHMPIFGWESKENELRRQQRGESCQIHGYFDTNKVPGNFHIGTHGSTAPSYMTFFDEPAPPKQNMQHTINSLAFVDLTGNASMTFLNSTQPLDGFESPKAFTFQYYMTINPTTVRAENGSQQHGYQFRSGSFVTNELIGPAVFFRLDIDPIRVTHYTEEVRWSRFLVNISAILGGSMAVCSMLVQVIENVGAALTSRD